jgi:hypothetical protein
MRGADQQQNHIFSYVSPEGKRPECTVLLSVQESVKWTLQRDRPRRLLAIWNAYETGGLISSV